MYVCQLCNKVVRPRTRCHRVVMEYRDKYYPRRIKVNCGYLQKRGQVILPLTKSKKKGDRIDDPGGKGREIVREVNACPKCANKFSSS